MHTTFILASLISSLIKGAGSCGPTHATNGDSLLMRVAQRVGLTHSTGKVVHFGGFDVTLHSYESDRSYPPYLADVTTIDQWFEPGSGVQLTTSHTTIGGSAFSTGTTLGNATASFLVRDTALVPSAQIHTQSYITRPLNAWAMLTDWLSAPNVRVTSSCEYRDYPRVVLSRRGLRGEERLFIDSKSFYPVKLERTEPHYLWGQVRVEFLYSTWQRVGYAHVPGASFRLEDGKPTITRTFGETRFVSRDSAPALSLPQGVQQMSFAIPGFLAPTNPDTVRVGPATFLLKNRGYAETVTLARDTVFIFDATQGEIRAREDSAWIGKLFPGHHPIVVVVTDLAWPHIAGVRYWVAQGATIVSHRAAYDFLAQVVARRWTLAPDLLEQRRRTAKLHFRVVVDSLHLAGGDILLFPIDGIASEVALGAFVIRDRFLWASDYIQTASAPTQYLDEVVAAVKRFRIVPTIVAAEHLPLTPWKQLVPLADET